MTACFYKASNSKWFTVIDFCDVESLVNFTKFCGYDIIIDTTNKISKIRFPNEDFDFEICIYDDYLE